MSILAAFEKMQNNPALQSFVNKCLDSFFSALEKYPLLHVEVSFSCLYKVYYPKILGDIEAIKYKAE
jgi:hypothetical protein